MKTVSVVVAVYNCEQYIDKCIQSVLGQTFQDFELLLVNDGSTDNSAEILRDYAKRYPKQIRVFERENGGLALARNYAMEQLDSKYIAFLDADDYIDRRYLEILVSTAEKHECDVVCSGQFKVQEDGTILKTIQFKPKNGDCLSRRLNIAGKLYRTEYIRKWKIEFPIGKLYEDNSFNLQAFFLTERRHFLDYNGYYQVVREGSITSKSILIGKLPLEEWESCIKKVLLNCKNTEDVGLFEFTVLSFFTYFLLVRNRKREYLSNDNTKQYGDVYDIADCFQSIVNKHFPLARKNKYATIFKYHELSLVQKIGVKVFAWICYVKKLNKFTKLFYGIASKF